METRSLTLCLIAQVCCVALAQAQSPNTGGTWNVEISFAEGGCIHCGLMPNPMAKVFHVDGSHCEGMWRN
jgi:hypothetical protein